MLNKINKTLIFNWLEGRGAKRTAVIVNLLIVIVIAHTLAGFTWMILSGSGKVQLPPPPQTQAADNRNGGVNDYLKISHLHLFGKKTRGGKKKPPPKPQTRTKTARPLNLDLKGILYNDDQKQARAMINTGGRDGEGVYAVGASINNQATVERIEPRSVILVLADNSQQVLKLPEESVENKKPSRKSRSSSSRKPKRNTPQPPPEPDSSSSLAALREELLSNPDKISQIVRIAPVSKGRQFLGFRVSPGKDRNLFKQLGLRSGDVVTAVDSIPLDSPQRGFEVAQKFATASELNLTVKRGGSERSITIRF